MNEKLAHLAASAARDKKAARVVIMDLRGKSDICDYQLICSGESDRQTRAIADEIEGRLRKEMQTKPFAIEGKGSGHWILMDYGSTFVHIFLNQVRDYYAIENIWPDAVAAPASQ